MADQPPPVRFLTDTKIDQERYSKIKEKFVKKYNCEPQFYARAPGRVNLIGEHIDYCGYGVLPMAIEQDVVIAVCATSDSKLSLSNTHEKYCDFECSVGEFEIDKSQPDWHNYVLCGVKGMTEFLTLTNPVGMQCVVDGCVPSSAGLSSSSALVCCAALATMQANNQSRSKREVADMCASCERYIGTQGGGMDQAISFMARPGTAKKIDFNPLREEDVCLPEGVAFVISNSCVEKNKAATSDFNTRVVECRLAMQVIAKSEGLTWRECKNLADLQNKLKLRLQDMDDLVQKHLHKEKYTKKEVCEILGVSAEELAETSLSANTLHVESFCLYQRARHVYSEALRVEEFQQVCKDVPSDAAIKLGKLMNQSHESCSKWYECSCTQLDDLVNLCIQSGAIGSRLTGAGWGGCAVSMVPSPQLTQFLEKVKDGYYMARKLESVVIEALFATQPGDGAAIYLPS
ncbi:N-acetylgalactosamine kinase-like [Mercenaria mercenaria]|uniref:N-acetylgalactosamine kinase-like n=1 Tax=Mercenaria mercenaria TaxID=6596 RepID=UPI00234F5D1E|nr:N-acetylgalactosamine kinase-like [Mercenaria mercenaria]